MLHRDIGYALQNPFGAPKTGEMSRNLPVPTSPPAPPPPVHEVVLRDEPNPTGARTIFSMVTPRMQEAMDQHLFEHPELFHLPEKILLEKIKGLKGGKPHGIGETENRLRVAFWMEFDRAVEEVLPINLGRVYGGVCTGEYFYQNYLRYPEKVAWLLCPPASYVVSMEEALLSSIDKIREVLNFPLYKKNGEPDTKVGELILKAFEKLDLRVKGAVVQRIETKNLHAHARLPPDAGEVGGMEELDKRLADLEMRATQSGLPIEVKADGEE